MVSAGFRVQGVVQAADASPSGSFIYFASTPTVTSLGSNDGGLSVTAIANNAAGRLDIRVTGNNKDLHWVATVRTAEVSY